ncbi:hyaluronan synthase [Alteromonas sp. KC3]|uniref:hydrogen peroxide-inducible genes activator n=1 Tax=unclassified Alteromonas TaxID=2614992 RepID=UPI001921342C|nr:MULTISPECIES: hydrogen peroxide-inducible genes activator [unclassified Alteromonas]BCO18197.1 hyaluronan synthase [Alteromonas sp. KC3]BCO22158.1 hyaluronan synthase [Alteromonas sp. KC14]
MQLNGKTPSINQIRYFVAVAKYLSFRQAAGILGISQPTLTSQISALETTLGLNLFERSRTGTLLSPQGKALLSVAEEVLQSSQRFGEIARDLSEGNVVTYRLGIPPTLGPYLLPFVLPDLHKRKPGLRFYVREGAPSALQHGLLRGEYDLILSPMSGENSQLITQPLFNEPLKFVIPSDHHLAGKAYVRPEEISGEKVLTLEDRHHFHHQVQRICDEIGADLQRDYEGTSLDTLRQMVVMGMGVAFLPGLYIHSELHKPEALHVCEIADMPIERQHSLAWRNTAPGRQTFREIAVIVKNIIETRLSNAVAIIDK